MSSCDSQVKTAHDVLTNLHTIAGPHPGFRTAHAHGDLVTGLFTPTAEAAKLTTAPHFNAPTRVTVRFSTGTGNPHISDTDPNAMPRGMATRFHLEEGHTDIVAHSVPTFPVKTGEGFLEFTRAIMSNTVPQFASTRPECAAHLAYPKPSPVSFATQIFYSVVAFRFGDVFFRYRWVPVLGFQTYTKEELKEKSPTYLHDELRTRLEDESISFKLVAQIAEPGDITDVATELWPETRRMVELGEVVLDRQMSAEETLAVQKQMVFDPVPRVEGIAPSGDPLLSFRETLYGIAGKERRAAKVDGMEGKL